MRFELGGGDIPSELGAISILNQAGEHLYSMHPWRWIIGRSSLMDLRGVLSGSTATWTNSGGEATLTATGAFSSYSFLAGDEIQVTDGTGATTGVYKIASKTDSDDIVLDGSLSASDLATGDIVWRIDPQTIALPSDLRDIISIQTTSTSSVGGVTLVPLDQILQFRRSSASITASTGLYYGTVVYTGEPPAPILEIYPSPSANQTGAMRIFYRSRWATLSNDTNAIEIPDFVQALFIQIARAFAGGYVRNDQAGMSARLADVQAGPLFAATVRSDGAVQPFHGRLLNGGAQVWRRHNTGSSVSGLVNRVGGPAI